MAGSNSVDQDLRRRAEAVIPGGMYGHQSVALLPDDYPQFFASGDGAWITDVDGRRYLDFMCAYGPSLFGYAHPGIDAAYARRLGQGDVLTGPSPLMVELAEAMVAMVSHADWAMFCKNGTDATTDRSPSRARLMPMRSRVASGISYLSRCEARALAICAGDSSLRIGSIHSPCGTACSPPSRESNLPITRGRTSSRQL